MNSASSFYVRISMSEEACDAWLASPIKIISDFDDWAKMGPSAARTCGEWTHTFARPEFMSVEEYLDSLAEVSRYFCCDYDDTVGAFVIADAENYKTIAEAAERLAALRGASDFIDTDEPSYAIAFPAISGGDPDALLEISRGASRFIDVGSIEPSVLYFVNEAEEFIETMLEDDD